jgi:hypothetical protein
MKMRAYTPHPVEYGGEDTQKEGIYMEAYKHTTLFFCAINWEMPAITYEYAATRPSSVAFALTASSGIG